ncbi:Glycosyl transferase, family 1, partial [Corchorus capsularis]
MGRNSSPPSLDGNGSENGKNNNSDNNNDQGFHSIRDRFPLKRNPIHTRERTKHSSILDRPLVRNRPRFNRKGILLFPFRGIYLFYFLIFFSVFAFAMASMLMQSSIAAMVFRQGGERGWKRSVREGLRFGSSLKFMPVGISRWLAEGGGLDRMRSMARIGARGPRLALILGNMKKDPLMLLTVVSSLQRLGYVIKIYAVENGKGHSMWEHISGQISFLGPEQFGHVDWSIFEGVIADSLEAKEAISSLMQEPFDTVPVIWIIQEDTLAKRLPVYEEMGLEHLVSNWRSAFTRANAIVFPDFALPMLYSVLDTGNFLVIPGSPADVWGAEYYFKTHTKLQVRKNYGLSMDDMVVVIVGSSFFYDELSWDYAIAMHTIGPLLMRYARRNDAGGSFKFVFLSGNSADGYNDALQEMASRLGLSQGSVRHYGLDGDVNGVLLMADIVLYGSSQEEQAFPPLIIRAMTFGIPVITPDFPVMKKYVVDGAHGVFFPKHHPDALLRAFSLLISNGRLSRFAQTIASSGRLLAKNILASECITGYANLLENILNFPSDVLLPGPVSQLEQGSWEWNFFRKEMEQSDGDISRNFSVVYALEEEFTKHIISLNISKNGAETVDLDLPTEKDWDIVMEIDAFEDYERLELEEVKERMESNPGAWDEIYRNARKSEKLKFEVNERDEGELERTGQPVCIYEIYSGAGAWSFLHHGSLYRGLSL